MIIFDYYLRQDSARKAMLIEIVEVAERKLGYRVQQMQTDKEEFRSQELSQLTSRGITLNETVPYHSQTNGVIERPNQTVMTMARTALLGIQLPKKLRFEAARHAAYTKNHLPHKTLNRKVPLEIFVGLYAKI
jgi:transposase InsO family protein